MSKRQPAPRDDYGYVLTVTLRPGEVITDTDAADSLKSHAESAEHHYTLIHCRDALRANGEVITDTDRLARALRLDAVRLAYNDMRGDNERRVAEVIIAAHDTPGRVR